MADDLSKRGPADGARINLTEDYEVAYWTEALSCTAEELREAVAAVGHMADDVRGYIQAKRA